MPRSAAPAAPGKPTRARVCPAKLSWRSTMNQPTRAASTATIVPAAKAWTMKGYEKSAWMSFKRFQEKLPGGLTALPLGLGPMAVPAYRCPLRLAHHEQASVCGVVNLDRKTEDAGEGGTRYDFGRGAGYHP